MEPVSKHKRRCPVQSASACVRMSKRVRAPTVWTARRRPDYRRDRSLERMILRPKEIFFSPVYFLWHCWNVPVHPGCSTLSLVNSFHTGYQLTSHILFPNRFFHFTKASTPSEPFNGNGFSVCPSPHTTSPLNSTSSIWFSWPFDKGQRRFRFSSLHFGFTLW